MSSTRAVKSLQNVLRFSPCGMTFASAATFSTTSLSETPRANNDAGFGLQRTLSALRKRHPAFYGLGTIACAWLEYPLSF